MKTWTRSSSTGCLVLIALVSSGCGIRSSRGYGTDTHTADDGTVITRMNGKEIDILQQTRFTTFGKYNGNCICYLDAQKCQHVDGTATYDLLLTIRWTYTGGLDAYEDVSTRESLTLDIDGKPVRLWPKRDASREKDQLSHYITDSLVYPVSTDILRELADAREVFVTVAGEGGKLNGNLKTANIAAFKRFWKECGADTGQPVTPEQ